MKERQYNEQGFAFEVNKDLTRYAQETTPRWGDMDLPSLGENIIVLSVFSKNSEHPVSYLLFDSATQRPIDEAHGLESMAVCIEKHKLAKII